MKKMLTPKAIEYAKKILTLESIIGDLDTDLNRKKEAQSAIEKIIDEICETYEPTAIYKVDEQIYALEKQRA